jgi:hypothetical protein
MHEGLNADLGDVLVDLGASRTLDYRAHEQFIISSLVAAVGAEHRGGLLSTEGRAFWTELGPTGVLPSGLKSALLKLSFESVRIVVLLLADLLCWCSLKCPTRLCPFCKKKFTTEHFFSCTLLFNGDEGWRTLVGLCRAESWCDVVDFIFAVLRKWVESTRVFNANFRLHVLEFVNISSDPVHMAFRWNFV